jgi:hypothetical protein
VPTDLSQFTSNLAGNFRAVIEKAGMELVVKAEPLKKQVYVDKQIGKRLFLTFYQMLLNIL